MRTDFEIRISLQEEDGIYCAVVLAWDHFDPGTHIGRFNGWYNTGIVEWADTPQDAFRNALGRFKEWKQKL